MSRHVFHAGQRTMMVRTKLPHICPLASVVSGLPSASASEICCATTVGAGTPPAAAAGDSAAAAAAAALLAHRRPPRRQAHPLHYLHPSSPQTHPPCLRSLQPRTPRHLHLVQTPKGPWPRRRRRLHLRRFAPLRQPPPSLTAAKPSPKWSPHPRQNRSESRNRTCAASSNGSRSPRKRRMDLPRASLHKWGKSQGPAYTWSALCCSAPLGPSQ
mmetsp:Transcript_28008/g.65071  ORF Transcript_28008/g.65071 Transcript_28008/m.65071 type:complete len:214 (+) Transcript_28008:434-1075(+)